MPYTPPTQQQLASRVNSDITSRLPGSAPQLRRGIIPAIAYALMKGLAALYGYITSLYAQAVPVTATKSNLDRWASLWGVVRQQPTAAAGPVTATGTNGATIASGSSLQDAAGNSYTTNALATIASGTASITVTAAATGSGGNQASGAILTFVSPPSGVASTVTVGSAGITGGLDEGDDDQLLAALEAVIQQPATGGNANDYVRWAKSNTLTGVNVTRAWCFPLYSGAGTVKVYIADDTYSGGTTAAAGTVTAVQNYINVVRPVTATVTVASATKQAVNFTFTGGLNSTQQAQAQAALAALFLRAAPEGSIGTQDMILAVASAIGSGAFGITAPTTTQTATAGNILSLGTFAFS